MADIPQVLATYDALVGVALGAGLTYGFGALNRRHQEARERMGGRGRSAACRRKHGRTTEMLGQAFGPLYGEDVIDSRMPTPEERERLEIPEAAPVTEIKGVNRDSQHRPLHYIVKVTPSGRFLYGYRFGIVPES